MYDLPFKLREHLFWQNHGPSSRFSAVQLLVVKSCLMRFDEAKAIELIADWDKEHKTPYTTISRYMPGKHYHVLGEKFGSFAAAKDYAEKHGYEVYPDVKILYLPKAGD